MTCVSVSGLYSLVSIPVRVFSCCGLFVLRVVVDTTILVVTEGLWSLKKILLLLQVHVRNADRTIDTSVCEDVYP